MECLYRKDAIEISQETDRTKFHTRRPAEVLRERGVPRGGFTSLQVSATLSNYPGGYNVSTMGGMDGSIELNITGQMSQVTILWSDGNTSAHRTGLMAGTYSVTVSDNAAQSESKSYTLIEPQNSMSVMLYGNYSGCTMNGNINAMVNGGTPPYSYLWHGPMGPMMTDTWSMVTVWQPGMYGVWAVDANGDSAHAELTLQAEASVWAELSSPTLYGTANTGCTGNDGSIVIAIHGGAPPYMIGVSSRWSAVSSVMPPASSPPGTSPPQPGQTNLALTQGTYLTTSDTLVVINNLGAGNYDVKVSTMGGCGGSYQSIELTSPPELNVRVQPTVLPNGHYLSCDSCADATAQINVAGGTGPFQYAWMEMPEGEGDSNMRLKGASLFMKMKDPSTGSGQAGEAFGPSNPYLIGSDAQQSGLDGEKRYAAFAMDGLGCMGGETFILEKPKGGTFAADSLRARHIRVERISSYTPSDSLIFFGDSSIIFNHQQHHIFAYTGYRGPVVGSAGTPKDLQIQCQPYVFEVGGNVGSNNTFLNRYRGNVGIGTGTPQARLHVNGRIRAQEAWINNPTNYGHPIVLAVNGQNTSDEWASVLEVQHGGNPALSVLTSGRVIIGETDGTDPTSMFRLQVNGEEAANGIRIDKRSGGHGLLVDVNNIGAKSIAAQFSATDGSDTELFYVSGRGDMYLKNQLSIGTYAQFAALSVSSSDGPAIKAVTTHSNSWGGIISAVTSPSTLGLAVYQDGNPVFSVWGSGEALLCGGLKAKSIRVESDWCDYVFEDEHKIHSLREIELFTQTNKHLPMLPAESEISENGLNVGEVMKGQMLHIEEWTCYL